MSEVIVCCKLPHGLIINQGGKNIKLAGANASRIVGGFGMTVVSEELITAWLKDHSEFAPVKQGLIFLQATPAKAEDAAKEREKVVSGFEGLDPENPAPGIKPEGKVNRKKK